jgi:hypothetical protein
VFLADEHQVDEARRSPDLAASIGFARKGASLSFARPGSLTSPIDAGAALCWGARLSASFARTERGLLKDKSD